METISRTLRLAAQGDTPPPPYFTVAVVAHTILSVPAQQATPADQQRVVLEVRRRCLGAPGQARMGILHVWTLAKLLCLASGDHHGSRVQVC